MAYDLTMFRRIHCLILKELAQLRRDPRLFGMLLIAPILELTVLGFVVTTTSAKSTWPCGTTTHAAEREFTRALAASGYFVVQPLAGVGGRDEAALVSGRAGSWW